MIKLAKKCNKFAKVGLTFYQLINKPQKFSQDLHNVTKKANFRQIWSHCLQLNLLLLPLLYRRSTLQLSNCCVDRKCSIETSLSERLHNDLYALHVFFVAAWMRAGVCARACSNVRLFGRAFFFCASLGGSAFGFTNISAEAGPECLERGVRGVCVVSRLWTHVQ